jgi:hypothetical protein
VNEKLQMPKYSISLNIKQIDVENSEKKLTSMTKRRNLERF